MIKWVLAWILLNPQTQLLEVLNEAPIYNSLQACIIAVQARVLFDPITGELLSGQIMDGKIIGMYICRKYGPEHYERKNGETST